MNRSLLHTGLAQLLNSVAAARQICLSFPDLQNTPTPRLGLNFFIPASLEIKRTLLQELGILEFSTTKLAQRIDLPVTIGIVGKYSSGKSTLLNAFLSTLFEGQVPAHLMRATGNTATDQHFTYITHIDFEKRFDQTPDIKIVSVDHEFFRTINFIDTPGTGWKSFSKQEVSDLMSVADIILFLFKPTELLDALSVDALYEKFTKFTNIPMWYVITRACDYTILNDWRALRVEEFTNDLKVARKKLQNREPVDELDAHKRDMVAQCVDFVVNENTFLVDGLYQYGIDQLLDRIIKTFSTDLAKAEKRAHMQRTANNLLDRYASVIVKADEHIKKLADVLHNACANVIKSDAAKFTATTVISSASVLSQTLYAHLRQQPLRYDAVLSPKTIVASVYTYEPPEISQVKRLLAEMRQEKTSYSFEYTKQDILFGTWVYLNKIERMKVELVTSLRKEMDRSWSQSMPGLLSKLASSLDEERFEHTLEYIRATVDDIDSELREYFNRQRGPVMDCLRRPANKLIMLYYNDAIETTIFTREVSLLSDMKLEVPSACAEANAEIIQLSDKAMEYALKALQHFSRVIYFRVRELVETTEGHLNEHVYLPTKESLDFLFAERETLARQQQSSREAGSVSIPVTDMIGRFNISHVGDDVKAGISGANGHSTVELRRIQERWEKEWETLDRDFNVLSGQARDVAVRIGHTMDGVERAIENWKAEGFSVAGNSAMGLKGKLEKALERGKDLMREVVATAKRRGRVRRILEGLGVGLGVIAPGAKVWQSLNTANPNWTLTLALCVFGLAVAVWLIARMLVYRATFDRLIEGMYKTKRDELISELEQDVDAIKNRVNTQLVGYNQKARSELQRVYDEVMILADKSNKEILPSLDQQVRAAAKLAIDISKEVVSVRVRTASSLIDLVNGSLNSCAEEMEPKLKANFISTVETVTAEYTRRLDTYVAVFRQVSKDIAMLSMGLKRTKDTLAGPVAEIQDSV